MVANWYVPSPVDNSYFGPYFMRVCFFYTELGGIAIAPHPKLKLEELKPGFIMKPSFGVIPFLIDKDVICFIHFGIISSVA